MTTTGPTDWVSGERVFAPPDGTLDPDWLVPALLESAPGVAPEEARTALSRAWAAHRSGTAAAAADPLDEAARSVVEAAVRAFRA